MTIGYLLIYFGIIAGAALTFAILDSPGWGALIFIMGLLAVSSP